MIIIYAIAVDLYIPRSLSVFSSLKHSPSYIINETDVHCYPIHFEIMQFAVVFQLGRALSTPFSFRVSHILEFLNKTKHYWREWRSEWNIFAVPKTIIHFRNGCCSIMLVFFNQNETETFRWQASRRFNIHFSKFGKCSSWIERGRGAIWRANMMISMNICMRFLQIMFNNEDYSPANVKTNHILIRGKFRKQLDDVSLMRRLKLFEMIICMAHFREQCILYQLSKALNLNRFSSFFIALAGG